MRLSLGTKGDDMIDNNSPDFFFDLVSGRILIFPISIFESEPIDIANDVDFLYTDKIGASYLDYILTNKRYINFEGDDDYQRIVRWLIRAFYSCE